MGQVISVVGAGGKTTYIELYSNFLSKYADILVSTTTKMKLPQITKYDFLIVKGQDYIDYQCYFLKTNNIYSKHYINNFIILKNKLVYFNRKFEYGESLSVFKKKLLDFFDCIIRDKKNGYISNPCFKTRVNPHAIYAKIEKRYGKIYYFLENMTIKGNNKKFMHMSNFWISILKSKFEYILIEADGSRKKPLKFPKMNEPVISPHTDVTVGVIDISMVGKEFNSINVYNCDDFISNIDITYFDTISLETVYNLIIHKNGLFKNAVGKKVLYINKIDNHQDIQNCKKMYELLKKEDIKIIFKFKFR